MRCCDSWALASESRWKWRDNWRGVSNVRWVEAGWGSWKGTAGVLGGGPAAQRFSYKYSYLKYLKYWLFLLHYWIIYALNSASKWGIIIRLITSGGSILPISRLWRVCIWTKLFARKTQTERKGKEEYLYIAFLHKGTYKALRHGSHSFTCKQHHACLFFVAFTRCRHHSNWGSRHPIAAHYSFIDPKRMKGWVV